MNSFLILRDVQLVNSNGFHVINPPIIISGEVGNLNASDTWVQGFWSIVPHIVEAKAELLLILTKANRLFHLIATISDLIPTDRRVVVSLHLVSAEDKECQDEALDDHSSDAAIDCASLRAIFM